MVSADLILDSIIDSCAEIMEMMLPMTLTPRMSERPFPLQMQQDELNDEIIVSIGLTGDYSGAMSMYLSEELAFNMAGWMMEEEYNELNSEVCECIGEVINMIAGGLKNRLSTDEYEILNLA